MTLPKKAEKEYLQISPRTGGFGISAEPQHASELQALFAQYQIRCRLQTDGPDGRSLLLFGPETDRTKVQEILDGYRHAKGS